MGEMSLSSTEQIALIGFAARMGTAYSHKDGIVSSEVDLRSEAQLLMNLLSCPISTQVCRTADSSIHSNGGALSDGDTSDSSSDESHETVSDTDRKVFSFSCPALSLDCSNATVVTDEGPMRGRLSSSGSESSLETIPSISDNKSSHAPIVSMGRPLVVEDRDALRLSAEAMARNICQTFQRAVQWRTKCWSEALSRPLVNEEKTMKEQGASEEDLKGLLETPAAKVIACLNHCTIEVIDARTSFRVSSQKWEKDIDCTDESPPSKKRKLPADSDTYTETHVLSFQAVLNIASPAGYSEVTLEAPGIIEGTFVKNEGESTLAGASVEIDTRVLASMIERSSRIIARASTEALMEEVGTPTNDLTSKSENQTSILADDDEAPSNILTPVEEEEQFVGIVTPSNATAHSSYADCDETITKKPCPSLPDDFTTKERMSLRMVSPQPRGSAFDSSPFIQPRKTLIRSDGPSWVSPAPPTSKSDSVEYLTFDEDSRPGPSLPALVEVACAAMHK